MLFVQADKVLFDLLVFGQSLALSRDSSSVDCPHVSSQLEIRQPVVVPDSCTRRRRRLSLTLHTGSKESYILYVPCPGKKVYSFL